jgi:hypothetical protein
VLQAQGVTWELLYQGENSVGITGVCYHFHNNNMAAGRIIEVGNGKKKKQMNHREAS